MNKVRALQVVEKTAPLLAVQYDGSKEMKEKYNIEPYSGHIGDWKFSTQRINTLNGIADISAGYWILIDSAGVIVDVYSQGDLHDKYQPIEFKEADK